MGPSYCLGMHMAAPTSTPGGHDLVVFYIGGASGETVGPVRVLANALRPIRARVGVSMFIPKRRS
jgi:hypothetical protein